MVMGLYRGPSVDDKAYLPYTYTCPRAETVLRLRDRLFVYCCPVDLVNACKASLCQSLETASDGVIGVRAMPIDLAHVVEKKKSNDDARSFDAASRSKKITLRDISRRVISTLGLKSKKSSKVVPVLDNVQEEGE